MKRREDNPIVVQALIKGLTIFEMFKTDQEEYGIAELSAAAALPESGVQRILNTLEFTGYLYQNLRNRKYRLSPKVIGQSKKSTTFVRWQDMARKHMLAINEVFGETVNLAIRDGAGAVYIEVIESRHVLRPNLVMGLHYPLHCSALGQSLLLDLSESAILSVLPEKLEAYTQKTLTDKQEFLKKIAQAKISQFTVDDEEYQLGLVCIGAPIYGVGDKIVASVSMSTPSVRMTPEKFSTIVLLVKEAAKKITEDFQYLF